MSEGPTSAGALDGRVAVVTGGARGIGRAIGHKLAAAGATVVVGDREPDSDAAGDQRVLDVTSSDSVAAFIAGVVADLGGVDVLVNNAGIMFERPLEEQSEAEWDLAMAVNLKGPFLMARQCAASMRDRGGGAIVNVGSIEAFCANPFHSAYAASKGGVHGLTVALAVELGPYGIRCNAVAPGWIDTELNREYVDGHPDRDAVIAELARLHPIGRVGAPADVGDAVVWLASDGSHFVTGELITVDGGRTRKAPLPTMLGR